MSVWEASFCKVVWDGIARFDHLNPFVSDIKLTLSRTGVGHVSKSPPLMW